ncbi:MAG: type II toxin-antitoxin system VapB family antitoxin [Deltaproteobacteria bacterium]|nr:type II toxin-antitoxin system VapB family antitoxin [Deltaproteobacteria bacterium]
MKVFIMRTTVTLDEKLVKELVKFTEAKTKTAAVAIAVKEQIRRVKLKKLAGLLGTIAVDEKAIKESDKADMKRAKWLEEIEDEERYGR